MENRKVARFLLWLIVAICLAPVALRFFMPDLPVWVIGIGIAYAAICGVLLLPKTETHERVQLVSEGRIAYI